MLIIEFIQWTLVTLGIVTVTLLLAEKYGVELAIAIFASLIVVANIIASKIVLIGGNLIAPAAVIVYASTFLITDIISEIYGKEYAKKAVIAGFLANLIAVVSIMIAINWQAAPFVSKEFLKSFNLILGFTPRIVVASLIAYLVSQTHDVYAFHFLKNRFRGKHLWLRNNVSTIISQALDTSIFISIAFYGMFQNEILLSMMLGQYIVKVIIALCDTPFVYIAAITWKWRSSVES